MFNQTVRSALIAGAVTIGVAVGAHAALRPSPTAVPQTRQVGVPARSAPKGKAFVESGTPLTRVVVAPNEPLQLDTPGAQLPSPRAVGTEHVVPVTVRPSSPATDVPTTSAPKVQTMICPDHGNQYDAVRSRTVQLVGAQNASAIDRVTVTSQYGGWALSHVMAFGSVSAQYHLWECGDDVWQHVAATQQPNCALSLPAGVYTALGVTCPPKMTAPAAPLPHIMPTTTTTLPLQLGEVPFDPSNMHP